MSIFREEVAYRGVGMNCGVCESVEGDAFPGGKHLWLNHKLSQTKLQVTLWINRILLCALLVKLLLKTFL